MTTRHRADSRQERAHPIFRVHRVGALVVGLILWAFAGLGFANHPGFLAIRGVHVAGMTSNGLLAVISVIVGAILVGVAVVGGRLASLVCAVLGGLFVLSGLVNLFVLYGNRNYLAFTMPNVIFSLIVGLLLLGVGLYGRSSGQLPADSPFRRAHGGRNLMARVWHDEDLAQEPIEDEAAALRRIDEVAPLAEAEHAVTEGTATPEQEREVMADARHRAVERREAAWRRAGERGEG